MKSLNFTLFKEKLLDESKTQTIRAIFIPRFLEGEIISIKFEKEHLFHAKVLEVFPRQLRYINWEIAVRDGFGYADLPILECQKKLMEINKGLKLDNWVFIIRFEKVRKK